MLDECYTSLNKVSKKKMMNIKRRFSDEQIRSLETMFESESKLEAPTKLRLARELGLQPRQVAIWFQNKRARSKSKELERDYTMLQDKYNTLVSQFESLKNEHQSLVMQLHKLHGLMEKSGEKSWYNGENINAEFEVKPGLSLDGSEHQVSVNSDDNKTKKAEYLGYDEKTAFLNVVEHADDCLTSPENWGSFGSDGLLDQSSGSHQWWDFWS